MGIDGKEATFFLTGGDQTNNLFLKGFSRL